MKKQRAFTLIEMLVVLAVLVLLISFVLVSLKGAGGKARDARRMADLDSIRKALILYENDKEDWIEDNSGCGALGNGSGFFNLELEPGEEYLGADYNKSISNCLAEEGYIKGEIIDPSGDRVCSSAVGNCYLKYNSYSGGIISKVYLYAKLETEPQSEDATDGTPCDYCDSFFGMNYYLRVK